MRKGIALLTIPVLLFSCKKNKKETPPPPQPQNITVKSVMLDNTFFTTTVYGASNQPTVRIQFSGPVKQSSANGAVSLSQEGGSNIAAQISFPFDSIMLVKPGSPLAYLTKHHFTLNNSLQSASGGGLAGTGVNQDFVTGIDSSRKFPAIAQDSLLTLIQKQTFKYFWDFGHPVSGLARERNSSGDVVTSGGSGFGIMAIPVAVERGFITRAEGLTRMQKITGFLTNTAVKVKGAFSHWLNGSTGAIVPFSANDNGADLVETSYLMMGLLTARQYFNGAGTDEVNLRADINTLFNNVEWDWFRQGGQDVLYWHYSPDKGWIMNMKILGWNEALITYVMAASSTTHGIPATVYTNGWAGSAGFQNGNTYFGYTLPLGPAQGGPLFFEQYTFMGINPNGLTDAYANYATQARNHTLINYNYCRNNPKSWYGYSDSCWGLTASDIPNGYTASSPTNDVGVIAPTAAISSLPFTPTESLQAIKFFYYVLGDKIWKEYGFVDAFHLKDIWFANSFLAIDQGPQIVMIENYRTGLIWNLFTSCPEVKSGLTTLGFSAPYL